jgi:type VI protein secretion system component VasK
MADDESPPLNQTPAGNIQPAGPDTDRHRRRKRKVKRRSRLARRAGYLVALAIAVTVLMAVWYYLVSRPAVQPTS